MILCDYLDLRSSFFVLLIGIHAPVKEKLGTVGMAQRDGVEQRRTSVSVDDVDIGSAQRHQRLQAITVTST